MSIPILLETIRIEDGNIANLPYHQKRCECSQKALYGMEQPLKLSSIIHPPKTGLWRCRILYDKNVKSVEYIPYIVKEIKTIKMINSSIEYNYKYADRTLLNDLLASNQKYDEVLIIKNGYMTDTTISNIAFFQDGVWYTPKNPLLKGTVRQRLLDEGFLHTRAIKCTQLANYTQVALMNAMLGFKVLNDLQIVDLEGKIHDYQSFTNS